MGKSAQAENKKQFDQQIKNQDKQYKLQQFESQFYQMINLYRENVNEMKIDGYDYEQEKNEPNLKRIVKITQGRKIFVTMKTELECILSSFSRDEPLNRENFKRCYSLFYYGIEEFQKKFPEEKEIIKNLIHARNIHESPQNYQIRNNKDRKEFLPYCHLNFNYKPFSGHTTRLGHYFRHLYLTVNTIVKSDIVNEYEDKMKYLKLIRAQLSDHEQILLFYNWLGQYGSNWENDENSFFTEYCMIHNLHHNWLFDDSFVNESIEYLRNKSVENRKGKMFAIDT